MKTKLFMLLPVLSVAICSCTGVKKYQEHLDDYSVSMQFHEKFNILQLTDIHWNANTSTMASKQYLDKVLEENFKHVVLTQGMDAKIDLVELTGDQFMLSNAYHVDSFINYFEKKAEYYHFAYAVIWGNHDRHGLYNPNWLADKFSKAKHCIYIEPNDNLYGRSNFVINLTDDGSKNSAVRWQIANLDSGASFSETAVSPFRDYDYIRKDQTDWWLKEHQLASEKTGYSVPTLAYYHIPQDENLKAYNARKDLKNKFFKLEGFADNGNEKYASDFFDVAKDNGLKGAFMGHAHNVDWTVEYDGVVLGLGVKTGPELYYAHIDPNDKDELVQEGLATIGGSEEKFDLIGSSLVTINDYTTFDLEHLYFNERASGDFARWVKW